MRNLFKRRRRDYWKLRKGDLPSARIVEREPRLANLQENAVFRLLIAEERTKRVVRSDSSSISGPIGLLLFVAAFVAGPLAGFGSFMILILAGLGFAIARSQGRRSTTYILEHLNQDRLQDLMLTRLTPDDYIRGWWGKQCPGWMDEFARPICWTLIILGSVFVLIPNPLSRVGAILVISAASFYLSYHRFAPYPELMNCAQSLREQFYRIQPLREQFKRVAMLLLLVPVIAVIIIVIFMFFIFLAVTLYDIAERLPEIVAWVLAAAGFSSMAALAGAIWGQIAKDRVNQNYEKLIEHLTAILEHQRKQIYESNRNS